MDIVTVGAAWLHALGMVVVLGYYGILGRITLPALRRSLDREAATRAVVATERRAAPIVVLGVVLFVLTGVVLLLADDRYAGLGNLFASTWTTLMTVKHLVVIAMVGLALAVHRLAIGLPDMAGDEAHDRGMELLGLAAEGATALGAIALLLTAAAQAA